MQARAHECGNKVSAMFTEKLNWEAMAPQFVTIYTTNFTEDELAAILTFYKSPAGSAFLTKTPVVNQQIGQFVQAKVAELQAQVRPPFEASGRPHRPALPPT